MNDAKLVATCHELAHRSHAPLVLRYVFDVRQCDNAYEPPVLGNRHGAQTIGQYILREQLRQGHTRSSRGRGLFPDLANRDAAHHLTHHHASNTLLCGVQEEPPDKGVPETTQIRREECNVKPQEDEAVGNQLPDEAGNARSRLEVVAHAPDDSTQHAPTVQGEARYHVEQAQQQVDERQVTEYSPQRARLAPCRGDQQA